MSRGDFKLVTHPDRNPAVDFITRSSQGPFVDTGVDVQFRPQPGLPIITERVYISVFTLRQLAQLAGIDGGGDAFTDQREAELIALGKLEGMREELGGKLGDVADTLKRWLDDAGISGGRTDRS